jgi:hypothetical protein
MAFNNVTPFDPYAALLHARWTAGKGPAELVGYWAEDGNEYAILVPPQLRDTLLELQNVLADRYDRIRTLRVQLARAEADAQALLGDKSGV